MAIVTATATFDGSQDTVAVTWAGITSNPPTAVPGVCVSDQQTVDVCIPSSSLTNTGCTVVPTSRFIGTVEIVVED